MDELTIGQRVEYDRDERGKLRKHITATWRLDRPGESPVWGGLTIGGPYLTIEQAIERGASLALRSAPDNADAR